MPSVGIPRALLFYEYYPLWKSFLEELGAEIIISGNTNKQILDNGIKSCVDEACLPIKAFFGHVIDLKDKVDYIFIPRIMSVSKKEYICPKIGGLPDMIKSCIPSLPKVISTKVSLYKSDKAIYKSILDIGGYFTKNTKLIYDAYNKAVMQQTRYKKSIKMGGILSEYFNGYAEELPVYSINKGMSEKSKNHENKQLNIALIGHPYNVYDSYVNMSLIDKLQKRNVKIITMEMLKEKEVDNKADILTKKMFWTFGRKVMGATLYFTEKCDIDGIIFLMSFGCGIDSFVCDLAERHVRRNSSIPIMVLTIDEHSGEAGMNTRIEAFIDMITWRKKDEGNVPAYGKPVYNS